MENKQERLDQIKSELDKLLEEKYNIEQQLAAESSAKNRAKVEAWKLTDDSCLLLFAKKPSGYHWWIAKTIKVKEIDFDYEYIDLIEANYGEADYEYYVKVEEKRIPFSSLENLENEFNIYLVDEVQKALLNQYFCELKLTYSNYKEYESQFATTADMSIKLPI